MPVLDLAESIKILENSGIKFAKGKLVRKENELEKAAKSVGFPLAMKIVSPKITHKTDLGGIKLGIKNADEAKAAFSKMQKLSGFAGVYLQQMAKGHEIIIGGKVDETFGPIVLFGLGGIFVEVFKDVSIRVCPLAGKDAEEMMDEIKGSAILHGTRGQKPVNLKKIKSCILAVSKLMEKKKEIKELDINPLFANEKEVLAVDARVVV